MKKETERTFKKTSCRCCHAKPAKKISKGHGGPHIARYGGVL